MAWPPWHAQLASSGQPAVTTGWWFVSTLLILAFACPWPCSFGWRDRCNRCGRGKPVGGGTAAPAAGGYGGYDGAPAAGGYDAPPAREAPRAAPQGPPGEPRLHACTCPEWMPLQSSCLKIAASQPHYQVSCVRLARSEHALEASPKNNRFLPLPRAAPACRQVCPGRLDLHRLRQRQLGAAQPVQPVQHAQARHL